MQIMILEKGRVHGYDWDGRAVREAAEKIILKGGLVFPYEYRIGTESDQKQLREFPTFKEALEKRSVFGAHHWKHLALEDGIHCLYRIPSFVNR